MNWYQIPSETCDGQTPMPHPPGPAHDPAQLYYEEDAVQAVLELWTNHFSAFMGPILFLDTVGSGILLSPLPANASQLLDEVRQRITKRYLEAWGREPVDQEWEAICQQADQPLRAALCRERSDLIRTKHWDLCEMFLKPAEFAEFWTTGNLPRPISPPNFAENLVAARTQALQDLETVHLEIMERPPTEAEWAALFDPAVQLFTLPDGVQIPRPAAAAFFPELAAACGGELSRRELLQLVTTRATPAITAKLTPERLDAVTLRLECMTETITNARKAPPVLKDWLALYELGKAQH